jgi:hypothetical protein
MGYLFAQTWIWILIAFVLGLAIGFAIAWFSRKKKVEVTHERVAGPATGPMPLYMPDGRRAGTLGAAPGAKATSGPRHAAPEEVEDQPPADDTPTTQIPVAEGTDVDESPADEHTREGA